VDSGFPAGTADERELLLRWLNFLRGAVLRKVDGIDHEQARWTPDGRLRSLLGIVNHLTHVEWRWIDGGMLGETVSRSGGAIDVLPPGRSALTPAEDARQRPLRD
jgi:hypothetical protein